MSLGRRRYSAIINRYPLVLVELASGRAVTGLRMELGTALKPLLHGVPKLCAFRPEAALGSAGS
jgi:hypothetical protein